MLRIEEIGAAELPRLIAVRNIARPDDHATVEGLVDWRRQAEDMVWLLAIDGGDDVGAGMGLVGWHSKPGTASVAAWTRPEARGHGVGQALYEELLRWSAERGCVEAQTSVAEDDQASLAWADRRGFREVGRDLIVVLDLTAVDAPELDPPPGIEIVTWAERPELTHGIYDVYVEADPDIPGGAEAAVPDFDEWLSDDMQGSSDRPDAVFVALAGDEVVGYAKLAFSGDPGGTAYHDLTGVKRAWRGRGVASALKRAQIAYAKEQGFERLQTVNERRNAPIRHLNERYGYRPQPGRIILSTKISGID